MCACIVLCVTLCGLVEPLYVLYYACLLTVFGIAFIISYCDIFLNMA
jgi:hypothetical protein